MHIPDMPLVVWILMIAAVLVSLGGLIWIVRGSLRGISQLNEIDMRARFLDASRKPPRN